MARQQGGSVKLAGALSTSGLSSNYDIRPGWVNSTNLQSRSVLGRDQTARASWLMSRGSISKDSSSLSGAAYSSTSRGSSTSGAQATGTCCADAGGALKACAKADIEKSAPRSAKHGAMETPVYKAASGSDCLRDVTPVTQAAQQNLLMSFSEPNGSMGPSTPSISDAGCRPHRRLSSAGTRKIVQSAADRLAPRPSPVKEEPPKQWECMQAALVSTAVSSAPIVHAEEDWLVKLVRLIQAPPSIDLVPLRSKFARPQVAAACH